MRFRSGVFFFLFSLCLSAQKTDSLITRYPDHSVRSIAVYRDSLPSGTWLTYFPNGNPQEEISYLNGQKHGMHSLRLENGNIVLLEYFKNDLPDSVSYRWYDDGHLKEDIHYALGEKEGLCRTYLHDGHYRTYVFYANHLPEGRYLIADETGQTIEEGFAWHGKWVWYREFRNGKLYQIRGLDTLSGKDSVRIFYPSGFMMEKSVSYIFDSPPRSVRSIYDKNEYPVYEERRESHEDGFYYHQVRSYATGADTLLVYDATDSIETYLFLRQSPDSSCQYKSRQYEYYADGKINRASFSENCRCRTLSYSPEGLLEETNTACAPCRAFSLTVSVQSGRLSKLSASPDDKPGELMPLPCHSDTAFYPNGKIRSVELSLRDDSIRTVSKLYDTTGVLLFEMRTYKADSGWRQATYYPSGKIKMTAVLLMKKGKNDFHSVSYGEDGKIWETRDEFYDGKYMVYRWEQWNKYDYAHSLLTEKYDRDSSLTVQSVSWYEGNRKRTSEKYRCTKQSPDVYRIRKGQFIFYDKTGKLIEKKSRKGEEYFPAIPM